MGCLLDTLPIPLLNLIMDYKLDFEEFEAFSRFLDRIYGFYTVY